MLARQIIKIPSFKRFKTKTFLWLSLIAALVCSVAWGIDHYYLAQKGEQGEFEINENVSKDFYKNLDLSLAAKATYTNQPIHKVKDLGIQSNVQQSLITFSVPKDGLSEYALMTMPTLPAPKKTYPVIILCHGYANPGTYSTPASYLSDMEFYAQHGFVVIKPDFRGQGLSFTHGSADGAYYSMGYNTDVLSLIAAVKQTAYLDKNAINVWGHSMGGYIALRAAVLSPDIKSVILLSAPVGNIDDMFFSFIAISDRSNPVAAAIRSQELAANGTPLTDPNFWNKTSPLNFLNNTKAYIQINVGSADKLVPPRFSAQLDSALTKLGKSHGYFVYSEANHGLVAQRSLIWERSVQVLAQQD